MSVIPGRFAEGAPSIFWAPLGDVPLRIGAVARGILPDVLHDRHVAAIGRRRDLRNDNHRCHIREPTPHGCFLAVPDGLLPPGAGEPG